MSDKTITPIDKAIKEISKASGFVLFVGVLTGKQEKGKEVINYHYIREKFSYENVSDSIKRFQEHLLKDMKEHFVEEGKKE